MVRRRERARDAEDLEPGGAIAGKLFPGGELVFLFVQLTQDRSPTATLSIFLYDL